MFILAGCVTCLVSCGTSARCQISRHARDIQLRAKPSVLETVFQSVSFGFAAVFQSTWNKEIKTTDCFAICLTPKQTTHWGSASRGPSLSWDWERLKCGNSWWRRAESLGQSQFSAFSSARPRSDLAWLGFLSPRFTPGLGRGKWTVFTEGYLSTQVTSKWKEALIARFHRKKEKKEMRRWG